MSDKVFCPWCGSEMTQEPLDAAGYLASTGRDDCWYECYTCGARSPLSDDPATALSAAQKRWQEPRKPISLNDVKWLGVPYFGEYKGVDRLFCYVTGDGFRADFAAAHELGWTGKTLGEFFRWENEHGKLQVRLWEARDRPPTAEERAAAPWEEWT
ncbi:MAG: hypothetical protein PHY12_05735 [Eubacteriales bacterium]|nr:hypothetical protein [Eubacteriales bacterium]